MAFFAAPPLPASAFARERTGPIGSLVSSSPFSLGEGCTRWHGQRVNFLKTSTLFALPNPHLAPTRSQGRRFASHGPRAASARQHLPFLPPGSRRRAREVRSYPLSVATGPPAQRQRRLRPAQSSTLAEGAPTTGADGEQESTFLSELVVKDFALVDDATVVFRRGLNVITGESGSGKSVLVRSLLAYMPHTEVTAAPGPSMPGSLLKYSQRS